MDPVSANIIWTVQALLDSMATANTAEQAMASGLNTTAPPADTMIATQMAGQLGVLSQQAQNAAQNQMLLQTAMGATQTVQQVLQDMESLAVTAANNALTRGERSDLVAQYNALVEMLEQTSQVTYNGIPLLNPPYASMTWVGNALPVAEVANTLGPQINGPPVPGAPIITAITFASVGAPNGNGWVITIHGINFHTLASVGVQDVSTAQAIIGPAYTTAMSGPTNINSWTQDGYTTGTQYDYYELDYAQSSSTALTMNFSSANMYIDSAFAGMVPGAYLDVAVEGTDGQWAAWQGPLPATSGTLLVPLPTQTLAAASTSGDSLVLPVVTPVTLGLIGLSLATPQDASTAVTALQVAQARLSAAQADLGAEAQAIHDRGQSLSTTWVNLDAAQASLADANMADVVQRLAQSHVIQQWGVYALLSEEAARRGLFHAASAIAGYAVTAP